MYMWLPVYVKIIDIPYSNSNIIILCTHNKYTYVTTLKIHGNWVPVFRI